MSKVKVKHPVPKQKLVQVSLEGPLFDWVVKQSITNGITVSRFVRDTLKDVHKEWANAQSKSMD